MVESEGLCLIRCLGGCGRLGCWFLFAMAGLLVGGDAAVLVFCLMGCIGLG